jgi:uncharacterized spore protein YtfJ
MVGLQVVILSLFWILSSISVVHIASVGKAGGGSGAGNGVSIVPITGVSFVQLLIDDAYHLELVSSS